MQGTLKWIFEDDEGKAHTFLLPGSLYTPDIPVRLLSPQHWAQHNRDRHAHCDTNATRIQLRTLASCVLLVVMETPRQCSVH
jgi:hypothetical protein